MFKSENEIKNEYHGKLDIFFDNFYEYIKEKNNDFSNKEKVLILFEFIYRFKKLPDENLLNSFKDLISSNEKNNNNFNKFDYNKSDLIKISFLLTKWDSISINKQEAINTGDLVANLFIKNGLEKLKSEEIKNILINFCRNKLNPNIELLTHLEPYIIKNILKYDIKSIVAIFYAYLSNFRGTDFFIKTLGFTIKARIKEASIEGMEILFII